MDENIKDLLQVHIVLFIISSYITLIIWASSDGKKNNVIGYRTKASLKSDENWKIANSLSKKYALRHYLVVIVTQFLLIFLIPKYSGVLSFAVYIIGFLVIMFVIEDELG